MLGQGETGTDGMSAEMSVDEMLGAFFRRWLVQWRVACWLLTYCIVSLLPGGYRRLVPRFPLEQKTMSSKAGFMRH